MGQRRQNSRKRGGAATTRGKPKRKERSWARRILVALFKLALIGGVIGALGLAGLFAYHGQDLPDVAALHEYQPPQITRVLDRNGAIIGEHFHERRTVIPMERIPRVMVLSVLAAEDADFYRHHGIDYYGIARAIGRDLLAGRAAQGASTITQQVVKLLLLSSERTLRRKVRELILAGRAAQGASTITQQVVKLLLLSPERTLRRKVRELILAGRVEDALSKDEILHLYLNHINFGRGRYGVQEAAQYYFGKDAEDLTLAEATLIAGVPQSPARLDPRRHPEAARRRQLYVLRQLELKREQYWPDLTLEEIEAAREATVNIVDLPPSGSAAPEIMRVARETLRETVGADAYRRGGFTVHTSIDLRLQRRARRAVQEGLRAIDGRHDYHAPLRRPRRARDIQPVERLRVGRSYDAVVTGRDDEAGTVTFDAGGHPVRVRLASAERYNPEGVSATEFAQEGARARVSVLRMPGENEDGPATGRLELGPQAAAILIDPRTRDVLAMIGGYERGAGLNRATQAVRQPGSTFKPLVYGLGIRSRRFTPATLVVDAPAVYDQWQPQNYETWRHRGPIRLRDALARSINVVAVRVMEEVEPDNVVQFARQLGLTTDLDPSLSLALGASAVRPIEMVNAYATFAAGGRWAPPRIVTRIEGPEGDIALPEAEAPRDVLTPPEAYVITSMLTSVVRDGTARRARRLGRPVAGKTGTSNEARDAWFIGFAPSLVGGVWVGFDDSRPIGRRESGGRAALPIWIDMMRAALEGTDAVDFPVPSGVATAEIDPASGLLAYDGMEGALEEVFLEGTVPTERAQRPDVAGADEFLMEQLGGNP